MTALLAHPRSPQEGARDRLEDAVVRTLAYADVFDFAPTLPELQRYLIGQVATLSEVAEALGRPDLRDLVTLRDGHVVLRGREGLLTVRERRVAASARLYARAVRYARAVGSLPLVRMVGITGGVAPGNAEAGSDMDMFLVTATGRVWLARAQAIAVVRYAAGRGEELCPNYVVAETALALPVRDLYGAQELAHMQPIVGGSVYRQLRAANPWVQAFLPNASGPPAGARDEQPVLGRVRQAADGALRSPAWTPVETWERRRKIERFEHLAQTLNGGELETSFDRDHCKGHFEPYGDRIRARYEERCRRFGVPSMWDAAG